MSAVGVAVVGNGRVINVKLCARSVSIDGYGVDVRLISATVNAVKFVFTDVRKSRSAGISNVARRIRFHNVGSRNARNAIIGIETDGACVRVRSA